jgi:hypothetical protein
MPAFVSYVHLSEKDNPELEDELRPDHDLRASAQAQCFIESIASRYPVFSLDRRSPSDRNLRKSGGCNDV